MTDAEKQLLTTAILTISDPRGNWDYGWELLCRLAEMDPKAYPAPFRQRTAEEMFPSETSPSPAAGLPRKAPGAPN